MKSLFITFCSTFLMFWTVTSSRLYQEVAENDENPPADVGDFFRLLLLSKYGPGALDYRDIEEEKSMDDSYFDNIDRNEVPFHQAVQNYADWKKGNIQISRDQLNSGDQVNRNEQNIQETQSDLNKQPSEDTISKEQATTSGPDLLASMPPVTPNKGQKEYVMLRPPVDNHRKIEHWMQSMAKGIFGADRHMIQKRDSVSKPTQNNPMAEKSI